MALTFNFVAKPNLLEIVTILCLCNLEYMHSLIILTECSCISCIQQCTTDPCQTGYYLSLEVNQCQPCPAGY